MSLFSRAHDILNAKANKALDAAEKPDEMLDLSYEQMLDQITKVRQGLVAIAASRKQIELQEQQLQHSADHLQEQARTALSLG
jgi:phage shock protein A